MELSFAILIFCIAWNLWRLIKLIRTRRYRTALVSLSTAIVGAYLGGVLGIMIVEVVECSGYTKLFLDQGVSGDGAVGVLIFNSLVFGSLGLVIGFQVGKVFTEWIIESQMRNRKCEK